MLIAGIILTDTNQALLRYLTKIPDEYIPSIEGIRSAITIE
jgi:hypothetical protein